MQTKYLPVFIALFLYTGVNAKGHSSAAAQLVCGRWESAGKDLIVDVYMDNGTYKAKLVWYKNTEGKPLDYWTDTKNPDPKLRGRKLLGMSILDGLTYDAQTNSWENGEVYDSTHGRTWNTSACINKDGQLCVRGYWHFKFIGRTMMFFRVS
jgi:uncharacterized protein (DUF2147 family)